MSFTDLICLCFHALQEKIDFSEENVSGVFPVTTLVEWYGWMLAGCYVSLTLG